MLIPSFSFHRTIKILPLHFRRFIHKNTYKMNEAHVRYESDNEHFQLWFHYKNPNLKVDRQFNFVRENKEKVNVLTKRMISSVEKVIQKKNKKIKDALPNINILLTCNDKTVPTEEVNCGEVFTEKNNITLTVHDQSYNIVVNSPWVDSLELPSSILADFPVFPWKFETAFINKKLCDFTWLKSKDKIEWMEIGKGFMHVPSINDIGSHLKLICTPRNERMEGPAVETVSESKVEASPGECPFDIRHQFTKEKVHGNEFRVVTYNILADCYCDSDYTREVLFPYCPAYALKFDYRKQLLVKEIVGYNADIICLQEVDRKMFNHDLLEIFSYLNFEGDLALKGGGTSEGLAIFYNKNRFKKLNSQRIVFSECIKDDPLFADIWQEISDTAKLAERILERTTTMQATVIQSLENDEILIVANIHMYFHPDADHIRLIHSGFAIRYLENLVSKIKTEYRDKRCSLVFCGDFNSVPECGIYKLFTEGSVPHDFIDYKSCSEEQTIKDLKLKQSFQLVSACGTPKYTNYTVGFADCLDYIFYEKNNLEVEQVVPLPSMEELTQHVALPSVVFPSDHVALISDLKWLPVAKKTS